MLIYEVNYTVDGDAAPRFSTWLREHTREMLDLDGFEAAVWLDRYDDGDAVPEEDDPTDPRTWTLHYQVRDREALQAYFDDQAEQMRGELVEKFGDHVETDRRVFEQKRLLS